MQPIVRVKPKDVKNKQKDSISSSQMTEPKKKEKEVRSFEEAAKSFSFQKVFSLEDWKNEDIIEWSSAGNPFRKEGGTNKKRPWWHLVLSIVGAIVIGAVMGFSILQLFFEDETEASTRTIDAHRKKAEEKKATTEKENTSAPSPDDSNNESTKQGSTTTIQMPKLQAILIQEGNYSDQAAAQKMVQEYRTKGLASLMSKKAPYQIYLGIASKRDEALKLNQVVREQEIEVSLREFQITEKKLTEQQPGTGTELSVAVENGHQLFQGFVDSTAKAIPTEGNKVDSFVPPKDYAARHQEFLTKVEAAKKHLPKESQAPLTEMIQAVDLMVTSAKEAEKHPSTPLIWQIQEGLLRYAFAYEELQQTLR